MSLREQQLLCPFCNGTVALISINGSKMIPASPDNFYAFKCNVCVQHGPPAKSLDLAWSQFISLPPVIVPEN